MAMKAKAAAALLGITVLLGVGLAAAAGGKKPKKTPLPTPDEGADDEDPNDIEVVAPGDDGTPGEGPSLVIDADDAEDEADDGDLVGVDELSRGPQGGTPVDDKANAIADSKAVSTNDVINDVVDTVTGGAEPAPLAAVETSPEMDPDGTVSLARLMLAREVLPNWKSDKMGGDIQEWQGAVGLTPDGAYGIVSAARMAEEVGFLPLIRYWPKGTVSRGDAEKRYDSAIAKVIIKLKDDLPDSQAQIDALTASMNREVAVSYGNSNPPAQKTLDFIQDVNDGIAEAAELKGEKELKA